MFPTKLVEVNGRKVESGKNDFDENENLRKQRSSNFDQEQARSAGSIKDGNPTVSSIERSPYQGAKATFTTSTFQQEVINKLEVQLAQLWV